MTRLFNATSALLLVATLTGCAGQGGGAGEDSDLAARYADTPVHATDIREFERNAFYRHSTDTLQHPEHQVSFNVEPGSLKTSLSALATHFGFTNVYYDDALPEDWDCPIVSRFTLRGARFADVASQLLAPYPLRMRIHEPDRVIAIRPTSSAHHCLSAQR